MENNNSFLSLTLLQAETVLEEHYTSFVDLCGENDEVNTAPEKQALEELRKVIRYFNEFKNL